MAGSLSTRKKTSSWWQRRSAESSHDATMLPKVEMTRRDSRGWVIWDGERSARRRSKAEAPVLVAMRLSFEICEAEFLELRAVKKGRLEGGYACSAKRSERVCLREEENLNCTKQFETRGKAWGQLGKGWDRERNQGRIHN